MAGSTKDLLNMMSKLGKSGKGMFVKPETKVLTMKIARNEQGSFGVMLNDHNRVCSPLCMRHVRALAKVAALQLRAGAACRQVNDVREGSVAFEEGLRPFDRITHVDGAPLIGKISTMAAGRQQMMITVERPPESMFVAIAEHENQEGNDVYAAANAKRAAAPQPSRGGASAAAGVDDGFEAVRRARARACCATIRAAPRAAA